VNTGIDYSSYLIRFWREPAGASGSAWKGELEHIQSGRPWAFDGLEELLAALRQEAIKPRGVPSRGLDEVDCS